MSEHTWFLAGPDGGNPLGFLATMGLLRIVSELEAFSPVRLRWVQLGGWHPEFVWQRPVSPEAILDAVTNRLSETGDRPEFTALGKDLTASRLEFHAFAALAADTATAMERTTADFAAAFGTDALARENEQMVDTAFRTMAGADHQHFLETMRKLIATTTRHQLEKTLLCPWAYDDPMQTLSLRWDPLDDIRYALQHRDPSGDPSRKQGGSMQGANRLAIEGLPLFPTAAMGSELRTAGFRGQRASDTYWTWPIWTDPLGMDVIKSLLALRELSFLGRMAGPKSKPRDSAAITRETDRSRRVLSNIGVVEVYRSQRLTISKVRNFTPARSV